MKLWSMRRNYLSVYFSSSIPFLLIYFKHTRTMQINTSPWLYVTCHVIREQNYYYNIYTIILQLYCPVHQGICTNRNMFCQSCHGTMGQVRDHSRIASACWAGRGGHIRLWSHWSRHGKRSNLSADAFCQQTKFPQKNLSLDFSQWLELLWKSSFIGYEYAKYQMFHQKFPQEISFLLKIEVHNLPPSKNFRNSQKFPRTMSACLSRKFLGKFKGVSRKFQGCYN